MKKRVFIICVVLVSIALMLSGCGSSEPSGKKIVEDLKFNSEATQWNDSAFDITNCEIITYSPNGEYSCTYECNVTKKNDEYEIVANSTIKYSKTDNGWALTDYKENNIDVTPLSGMSDDDVIATVRNKFAGKDASVTNIKHNFDKNAKTDTVTADFTYEQPYYNKSGSVTINAFFDKTWWNTNDATENSQENWNLQPLIGTWQFERGNLLVQYKIYSIDEATQTVNFAVRYAQNGFVWGDGESNVAGKDFSETVQGKYSVTKRKNSDHVYVCGKTVYDGNFDHDYDLYCDEDGVYSYDGFYNKAYSATKVE